MNQTGLKTGDLDLDLQGSTTFEPLGISGLNLICVLII